MDGKGSQIRSGKSEFAGVQVWPGQVLHPVIDRAIVGSLYVPVGGPLNPVPLPVRDPTVIDAVIGKLKPDQFFGVGGDEKYAVQIWIKRDIDDPVRFPPVVPIVESLVFQPDCQFSEILHVARGIPYRATTEITDFANRHSCLPTAVSGEMKDKLPICGKASALYVSNIRLSCSCCCNCIICSSALL